MAETEIPKILQLGLVAFLMFHGMNDSNCLARIHALGTDTVDDLTYLQTEDVEALEITDEQKEALQAALYVLLYTEDLERVD